VETAVTRARRAAPGQGAREPEGEALAPRLRRERHVACLSDLTALLLRAPSPLSVLDEVVRLLREASGADRCYVLQSGFDEAGEIRADLRADSRATSAAPALGDADPVGAPIAAFDTAKLVDGEPIFGPADAFSGAARRALARRGICSLALLPIHVEGAWWGVLGLDAEREEVELEQADVALLRTAANAIGVALERARKEEALRESERRFRSIADHAFDMIGELGPDGTLLYANASFERVLGVRPESLIGENAFARLLHEDDRADALRIFREAQPTGTGRAVVRLRHEAGGFRSVECLGRFYDAGGEPRAVIIGRDVTERLRAETERARLEQAMDQAGDGIVVWDRTGRIVYVNAEWERLTGVGRADALGRSIGDIFVPTVTQQVREEMIAALRRNRRWQGRLRGIEGGFVDTRISAVLAELDRVEHYVSLTRDVTREVELESQVRRQQKLDAVGTLASGVARDFNNLLTGVLGHAELLGCGEPTGEEVREAAGVIRDAARRGAELTSQLLGLALRAPLRSEPVDVHEVVREVVRLIARTFPRSVAIRTALGALRSTVLGDPGQLQQVLLNLALNARDAMPDGGELEIATELAEGPAGAPELRVRVRDTGGGIPPEHRERVFEPFFTTKHREKGTGMGLAVAYGIVLSHGGSIGVESELARGATFEVRLPLRAAEVRAPAPSSSEPVRGEGRILVVDDEPSVRRVLARMLGRLGYEAVEAANGLEALDRVRAAGSAFSAVLLDLDMPGLDGRACLRRLRELAPALPVLLSTGLPASELGADLSGAAGVLPKPYQLGELARAVADAIRRGA
jgi:PAS domain S-box-containing protein